MATKGTTRGSSPEPELARLIEAAASATPDVRIDFRDRIASHGAEAMAAMETWVGEGRSPGFAIAVLEAVGKSADDVGAAAALRRIRNRFPDWADVAQQAMARVDGSSRPATAGRPSRPPADASMATGTRLSEQGPCEMGNRDGSACHNSGRYDVGGKWICTTHYKAAPRGGELR